MVIEEFRLPAAPGLYKLDAPKFARFVGAAIRPPASAIVSATPAPEIAIKVMYRKEFEEERQERRILLVGNGSEFALDKGEMVDFIACAEATVDGKKVIANVLEIAGGPVGAADHPREA